MIENEPRVRVGTPSDFNPMVQFLIEMHFENGMAPLSMEKMVPTLQCLLAQHNGIVGVIDGEGGEIAGAVGLLIAGWWYSEEKHLEDLFTFVRAPYRHMRMARPLLDFAKYASTRLSLPLLMGVLTEERAEAKVRLYQRQLPMVGALFLYRPPGALGAVMKEAS